jgi:sulfite reductase (NADPH) flavoprotein alpha-component
MRYVLAVAIVAIYIVFTLAVLRAHRRKNAKGPGHSREGAPARTAPLLVAYASQSGYAEQLAKQTAQSLQAANVPSRVRSLAELSVDELSTTERALFVVSTYGEGDPPDSGLAFVNTVMNRAPTLSRLGYGVLALGDRTYRDFCGFGRTLDNWLQRQCAVPMFDLVEVDNADEAALLHWQHHIGSIGGREDVTLWKQPRNERWQLVSRRLLNPGSAGHPCFHIELKPIDSTILSWSAGDIAVLTPPGSNSAREYSIASMPSDGSLQILVRQSRRPDGSLGAASGWLTEQAASGSEISLRVRSNSNFHSPADARPIILIGNGTGMAGLRCHLKARESTRDTRNWLIFGERNAAHDSFYKEDIERWRSSGLLTRADLVFSRDQPERTYVQDVIDRSREEIRKWVADGATLYVCGSAAGMATAVDEALATALGRDTLNALLAQRRYRRDVY